MATHNFFLQKTITKLTTALKALQRLNDLALLVEDKKSLCDGKS